MIREKIIDLLYAENVRSDCGIERLADEICAIDPVKHGRWMPWDLSWGRSVWSCSECGEATEVPTEMGNPIYKFCPNCGVRMEQ